ncbi:stage II sporulation protein M, partial [Pseudomonas aeruginosa]|nr:stage II sporulation protein M [Pseudomonas aeruginosa]
HQQFYRHRSHLGSRILGFLLAGLPRLVREEGRSIAVASLLFYGSALLMGLLVYHFPDLIYSVVSVVSPDKVSEMESMYATETTRLGPLGARDTSDDWEMF